MENRSFKFSFLLLFFLFAFYRMAAQEKILLYPNGPAESNEFAEPEINTRPDFVTKIAEPRMYAYFVENSSKPVPAVVICPGGGYMGVSVIKEGEEIARWFNQQGFSAFVLYYRMPNYHHKIPLKDAQTALTIIHKNAKKWNINQSKIGIMGFSAGGHLASTAGTHFTNKKNRPAFMILGYPVVSMKDGFSHGGSRLNLLGKDPDPKLEVLYSNELQVTSKTPPTFIFHAEDDKTVPISNSLNFVEALKKSKVPVELHVFAKGGHGFGMRPTNPETDQWPVFLAKWLSTFK